MKTVLSIATPLLLTAMVVIGFSLYSTKPNLTVEKNNYAVKKNNYDSIMNRNVDMVIAAKYCADIVFRYMNQYVNESANTTNKAKQKAAMKKFDRLAKPYQKRLDSLKALLPADEVIKVDDYRQALYNQVLKGTF